LRRTAVDKHLDACDECRILDGADKLRVFADWVTEVFAPFDDRKA
jgi:hypothetical protein